MPKYLDKTEWKVYTMGKEYKLTSQMIEAIEKAAQKADRIELIPGKEGDFKIVSIQREKVKTE